jgi:hypothetical protein
MNLPTIDVTPPPESVLRRHVADSLQCAIAEIVLAQNARDDLIRALSIVHAGEHIANAKDALNAAMEGC